MQLSSSSRQTLGEGEKKDITQLGTKQNDNKKQHNITSANTMISKST